MKNKESFEIVLEKLKTIYENYWKKNNEINTSIKLPLTVSVNSDAYDKIERLEKILEQTDLVSNFYILKETLFVFYYDKIF